MAEDAIQNTTKKNAVSGMPLVSFYFCACSVIVSAILTGVTVYKGYVISGSFHREGYTDGEWRKFYRVSKTDWVRSNIPEARKKEPPPINSPEDFYESDGYIERYIGRPLTPDEKEKMNVDIQMRRRYNRFYDWCNNGGAWILLFLPVSLIWSFILSVFAVFRKNIRIGYRIGVWAMLFVSLLVFYLQWLMEIPYVN